MAMQYRLALFNPLTYDEIVKPLQLLTELLHLYEDAYAELQTLADVLSLRAALDPDSAWAKTYQLYSNNLRLQAEDLLRSGLTPSARAVVNTARANYARDIAPIHVAINRLVELTKELAKLNPALRMQYQNMPTIDLLIMDPTRTPLGYSGADIEKSAMLSAGAASARNVINLFVKANPGFMEHIKLSGYDTKTIEDMLKVPELAGIVNLVKGLFGYSLDESLSDALKSRLDAEILSGLFKGVAYKDDSTFLQDPIYMANLNAALTDRNNQRLLARLLAALAGLLLQAAKAATNPLNIYSLKEMDEEANALSQYKKYFTVDSNGNYTLNKAGLQKYKELTETSYGAYKKPVIENGKIKTDDKGNPIYTSSYSKSSDFRAFMDKLGGNISNLSDALLSKRLGQLYKTFEEEATGRGKLYDATKLTEYNYNIDASDQANWTNIVANLAGGKLYPVDWNSKETKWGRAKAVDIEDALKDNGKVTAVLYSQYGTTIKVTDKNGKSTRYELPAGINPRNMANLQSLLQGIGAALQMYMSMGDLTTIPMPSQIKAGLLSMGYNESDISQVITRADLQELTSILENNAMMYMSQLGNTNTNKPQEWKAFGY